MSPMQYTMGNGRVIACAYGMGKGKKGENVSRRDTKQSEDWLLHKHDAVASPKGGERVFYSSIE